jgi:hypothetical protein
MKNKLLKLITISLSLNAHASIVETIDITQSGINYVSTYKNHYVENGSYNAAYVINKDLGSDFLNLSKIDGEPVYKKMKQQKLLSKHITTKVMLFQYN